MDERDLGQLILTKHARQRFKQRTGLPIRALARAARRALFEGVPPEALPPLMRDKILASITRHKGNVHRQIARVFDGQCYIFAPLDPDRREGFALITVLPGYDPDVDLVDTINPGHVRPEFHQTHTRHQYYRDLKRRKGPKK